ncbi:MAG TPA: hypothetical protein ENJ37_08765 [Deltaproteobacteria bacterium]|nr:hypothetical protein [Deltaproteobacteria bacterium]
MSCKRIFAAVLASALLYGCGTGDSPKTYGPSATAGTTTATSATTLSVSLTATPSTLTFLATSSVQATVRKSDGSNAPDGTIVLFRLSSSTAGSITSQATTFNGTATATFTAGSTAGTVTVTAEASGATATVDITIEAPSAGSITFVSATPQVIGLKGSGQTETSTLTFQVNDTSGNAVSDGTTVSFVMSGPSGGRLPSDGGEYIGSLDSSPTTASASTVSGKATVTLKSGTVAGPVTVTASVTVDGQTLSASSNVISIGGGIPSATHFSLAASTLNIPGVVDGGADYINKETTISAFVADRFGNYNVLQGTSVSFYTEAGAIDRSSTTDASGSTSVKLRSQLPYPADVAIDSTETAMINSVNSTFGLSIPTDGSVHPRDGWVTVLATVQGEEAFLDENGNGLFDRSYSTTACPQDMTCECDGGTTDGYSTYVTGGSTCTTGKRSEGFTDLSEPFIDKDDDGSRDDGQTSGNPFEEYIDANGNGQFDGPSGVWDGPGCKSNCQTSKMIWQSQTVAFTTNSSYCAVSPTSFTIADGKSETFKFLLGDYNLNSLVGGTKITLSATVGNLSPTSYTLPDSVPDGPLILTFTLSDPTSGDTDAAASSTIEVTVTSSDVVTCSSVSVSGTVD